MNKSAWFYLVCASCGSDPENAKPCTVRDIGDAVEIACPDGSKEIIEDGTDGAPGANGADGADGATGATGAPGVNGANGSDGADGVDGADGTDNHIIASILCDGLLEATTVRFTYKAVLLSSGDVWADGSIYTASVEIGTSVFYASSQVGAGTAAVFITFDLLGTDNGGWWRISLDRSTAVTTIVYTDIDASDGSDAWTMQPSACIVNSYP